MTTKSSHLRQPILSEISRTLKLNWLLKHLQTGATILEVGAGQGWFAKHLKSYGYNVTTLDISNREADIMGDINAWEQLGIQKNSYDAVIALEVIEHVDCLTSLSAISKIDGLIMLSSPHPRWDWVAKLLEKLNLTQKRTSKHNNLTDFAQIKLIPLVRKRPLWIHQVAIFKNIKK